jgi:DNA (cytosine-5)-methyltransferase 1
MTTSKTATSNRLGEGMRTISLFSGCGGMDLGAERAGADVVFANDNMAEAAMTYRRHWPEVEFVEGDVSEVRTFPDAELVIGGYPCQSFTLGGHRDPAKDARSQLYIQFARCVEQVEPLFFVAENVKGLKGLQGGKWLDAQLELFQSLGRHGYNVNWALLNAADYGVPQLRKRVIIVGVRRDFGRHYWFPSPTHASSKVAERHGLKPYESHGDAIVGLPLWPTGEFYERPHDPEGHWAWYYMSRNRKAKWDTPSYTILANFRHVPLHPASCTMTLTWSNLADGWKQRWDFSGEYEHTVGHPERPILQEPRRLSWREAALIQTFPPGFEIMANETRAKALEKKFEQVGNAVPPLLAEAIITPLISATALGRTPQPAGNFSSPENEQLSLEDF